MNRPDHEPLTTEERALAERLARDGSAVTPSAALDAAILGMARDAVAAPAPRAATMAAHRSATAPRRRWPFAVGIAASLALAVGIAWQLRPGPGDETPRAISEADMAVPATGSAVADVAPAPPPPVVPDRATSMPAPAPAAPAAAPPAARETAPAAASAGAADADEAVAEPRVRETRESASRDSAPADAPASTPAPATTPAQPVERRTAVGAQSYSAPSPPPPAAAMSLSPPAAAPAPPPAPPSPPAPAAPAPASAHADTAARRSVAAPVPSAQGRAARVESQAMLLESIDDVPDDTDPPATADAPEVRAAWLARVRELLDAGRIAEAKASLAEFHRRHPKAELPPDLRALLD